MAKPSRLIRLPEVKFKTGLSRSTIYQRAAAGTFPRPVVLGPNSVAWKIEDVEAWMEACPEAPLSAPKSAA